MTSVHEELTSVPIEPAVGPELIPGGSQTNGVILSPQAQFLTRLRLYALVAAFRSTFFSLPLTRSIADTVKPSLKTVRNSQPLKTVMDNGDLAALYILDLVDRVFPLLQLLEPHHITDPVTQPIGNAIKAINETAENATDNIQRNFIDPSTSRISNLLLDSNGRAILSSRFDPIFTPVNDNLELLSRRFCGDEIKRAPKEELASEFIRSYKIIYYALFHIKEPQVGINSAVDGQPVEIVPAAVAAA